MTARLLHTSDWHLGGAVRAEPRAADHDAVITEIVAAAAEFGPDLILHTGDLFDGSRPGHDDLLRGLRAVRRMAEVAPVVVLAGNHDAASCFDLLAEATGGRPGADGWDPYAPCRDRIRFLSRPCLPDRGAVATYLAADGTPIRLGCLPFVHANRVITGLEDLAALNATYADKVRKIMTTISASVFADFDPAAMVAVWAAHLHVDGAHLSSERAIHVASAYAADPAHLDAGYSYLAFGHVHRPQEVPGGRGRYAGSPLEIDFGEEGEAKTVVCVTAEPGVRARIEPRPLTAGRRLRRVRGSIADLAGQAGTIGSDVCVVTVEDGDDDEDIDSLHAAVRAALPAACIVQVIDARRPVEVVLDDGDDARDAPEDSLASAYRRWLGEGGDPGVADADLRRVVELFDELLAAVEGGDQALPSEAVRLDELETGAPDTGREVA